MIRIKSIETKGLLLHYINAAQGYEEGTRRGSAREANKHHSIAGRIFNELKRRGAEKELVPLLSHPRPSVRLWAAAHVLRFDPQPAKQVLEELAKNESGLAAVDAMTILEIWKERTSSK